MVEPFQIGHVALEGCRNIYTYSTFLIIMPLEEEFVRYLASLNSSEAEFNKLSLVERSIIRTNFTSSTSSASQLQQSKTLFFCEIIF